MNKFIELPIKVSEYTDEDYEKYESLGLEVPEDEGKDNVMYTHSDHIAAYIALDNGTIDLALSSGMRIIVYLTLEEFEEKLNKHDSV